MGWKYRAAWMHEHAEEIEQHWFGIFGNTVGAVLPILNMRGKASAAGGNGSHKRRTLRFIYRRKSHGC